MKKFSDEWEKITSDKFILDIVSHCHIEFIDNVEPKQDIFNVKSVFNSKESDIVSNEIQKLLAIDVIKEVQSMKDQFLSPIFLRPKKNGEYRMILNLKKLNEYIEYHHFKMDTFESAIKLVTSKSFMASIDLRHAYYSVPIAEEHQKFLRFYWNGKLFQYTCLPNGISSAPRIFTKLLKPVYSSLRVLGHVNVGYIDDSLLLGETIEECNKNVNDTIELMSKLGFVIHEDKSVFQPSKQIIFLGNIIDSENMIITLTADKKQNLVKECKWLLQRNLAKIRDVAKVIGLIVSSFSAVEFGKLFYRNLEKEKIIALKNSKGDFEQSMLISNQMKGDLEWWVANVSTELRHISHGSPQIVIQTDASLLGWGGILSDNEIGGRWTDEESKNHINYLEILAIYYTLKSFLHLIINKHVKVLTDNTTAVAYISNMGGTKSIDCNTISRQIWLFCKDNDIWLTCTHIAGKENLADKKSREFDDKLEWKLERSVFDQLCTLWQRPDIDLFASRLNFQLENYCSWKPDPLSAFIDAFSINWSYFQFVYLFPPFSLLSRCIFKIREDGARGVVIAPFWQTQTWFPRLMQLLTDNPIVLPKNKKILNLPHDPQSVHPLHKKMKLIACLVSGVASENEDFLKKQPTYSCRLGNQVQRNSTKCISGNGSNIVTKNKLIAFKFL